MALWWGDFRFRSAGGFSPALRILGLVFFLISLTAAPATAQLTPTPELQGYHGSSQAQPYQGAFADLANRHRRVLGGARFGTMAFSYASPNIVVVEQETRDRLRGRAAGAERLLLRT